LSGEKTGSRAPAATRELHASDVPEIVSLN